MQRLQERIATAQVEPPHPPHVPDQVPVLEELGHGALVGLVALEVGGHPQLGHPLDHLKWGDEVADAQAGGEDLGERAEVDHHPRLVATGQGQHRSAVEVELVVVVVLDDQHPVSARELQELEPPGRGEHRGGRELVVGGEVDRAELPLLGQRRQRAHTDSAPVHRHGHQRGAGEAERRPRPGVTEPLHRHHVTRAEEGAGDEVQRHLAPTGDEHRFFGGGEVTGGP